MKEAKDGLSGIESQLIAISNIPLESRESVVRVQREAEVFLPLKEIATGSEKGSHDRMFFEMVITNADWRLALGQQTMNTHRTAQTFNEIRQLISSGIYLTVPFFFAKVRDIWSAPIGSLDHIASEYHQSAMVANPVRPLAPSSKENVNSTIPPVKRSGTKVFEDTITAKQFKDLSAEVGQIRAAMLRMEAFLTKLQRQEFRKKNTNHAAHIAISKQSKQKTTNKQKVRAITTSFHAGYDSEDSSTEQHTAALAMTMEPIPTFMPVAYGTQNSPLDSISKPASFTNPIGFTNPDHGLFIPRPVIVQEGAGDIVDEAPVSVESILFEHAQRLLRGEPADIMDSQNIEQVNHIQAPTLAGRQYDSDGDTIPELISSDDEQNEDQEDDTRPSPPPSPPNSTSFKLFRPDQRLTRRMTHLAKFSIPSIAYPPAADDDASPASPVITSVPSIDAEPINQDDDIVVERRKVPRIALARKTARSRSLGNDETNVKVPKFLPVRISPSLVMEPGYMTTGIGERIIRDFITEQRTILAQASADDIAPAARVLETFNRTFDAFDDRHYGPLGPPRIYHPELVPDIGGHPGDM